MSSAAGAEVDPSVCYRHPDRTSWTLCERCGRTICPECQILTPSGVRCPTCVQEMGGSVQWTPAGGSRTSAAQARKRRATRARVVADRPRWQQVILDFIKPGTTIPVATWTIAVVAIALWILGFFSGNLPTAFLEASVRQSEWVWTYVTAPFAYPALGSAQIVLGFVLNIVFLLLIAPGIERTLTRGRFLSVFFAGAAVGSALSVLAGGSNLGLTAPLFGLFGAFLVMIWSTPALRNQILIVLVLNLLFTVVLGGNLLAILGGLAGGVGASLLFRRADSLRNSRPSTPYLLLLAAVVALVALAVLRGALAPV